MTPRRSRDEEAPLRAAALTGPDRIVLRDAPAPMKGELPTVRVVSVGICGTDLKIAAGAIPVDYPRVMGHEIVGTVIAGAGAGPPVGSTVLVDPGITCGACAQCRAGRGNICTGGWLLGRDRDGGLQDELRVPAANLHVLGPGIAADTAPLIQVLATCVHGQRMAAPVAGAPVVIVGLGVTGLLHLQLAKLAGAGPVIGITRSPEKLRLAEELGADLTVAADASDLADQVREATGDGAELVVECAGSVATLATAVRLAAIGGRILVYGTIPQTAGELPFYELYYKELVLTHPRSARAADFPVAIDAVASGRVLLEPLVSERFPLTETASAIDAGRRSGALKIFVDP